MAKTKPFDAAAYLDSREAIAAYQSEAFETHDAAFITEALETVARAQGITAVAKAEAPRGAPISKSFGGPDKVIVYLDGVLCAMDREAYTGSWTIP